MMARGWIVRVRTANAGSICCVNLGAVIGLSVVPMVGLLEDGVGERVNMGRLHVFGLDHRTAAEVWRNINPQGLLGLLPADPKPDNGQHTKSCKPAQGFNIARLCCFRPDSA